MARTVTRSHTNPNDQWRLIRASTPLISSLIARTFDGRDLTAEWGEPDSEGVYEPVFTMSGSTEAERIEAACRLDVEAVEQAVTNVAVRHGVTQDPPLPD